MSKRKSIEDYYKLANTRGFKWKGKTLPSNIREKCLWECKKGHIFLSSFDLVRRAKYCPICCGLYPKTIEDYYKLAKERGFKWKGKTLPSNTREKTLWECNKGHVWSSLYTNIQQGIGCPICCGLYPKTIEDYHKLAKESGFKWKGESLPSNVLEKTLWECSKGHIWFSRYAHIQQGKGCPVCYGNSPKSKEEYHKLAKEKSCFWLGHKTTNARTKTLWGCEKGHNWKARYDALKASNGCPICLDMVNNRPVSKPQREICEMLDGILNYPVGNRRVDVALVDEKIAIEYDSWYWHGNEQEDQERDTELQNDGWRILHIRSNKLLPTPDQLERGLRRLREGEVTTEIVLPDWGKGETRG